MNSFWPARGLKPKQLWLASTARLEAAPFHTPFSRERLSICDEASDSGKLVPGSCAVMVGGSSQDLPLRKEVTLH